MSNLIKLGKDDRKEIHMSTLPLEIAEEVKKGMAEHAPMKRLADPDEITNSVLFLASNESSYMTGTKTIIDGSIVPKLIRLLKKHVLS